MARLCKIIFCLMSVLFLVDSVICADAADPPSNDGPAPQSPADADPSAPPSPPNDLSGPPASPPKLDSPPAPPPSTNAPAPSLPKHSPTPSPFASDNPKSPTPAQSPSDADVKHVTTDTGMEEEKSKGSSSSDGMSGLQKLGISVGVILFVGVVAAGLFLYKKRRDNIARSRYAYAAGGNFL